MNNMPRPRRRREKKLMSMEDVNTRFPLVKYKLWRATREQDGLPAAGGVTATPSRAPSIKEAMEFARPSMDQPSYLEPSDQTVRLNTTSDNRDFATTIPAQGSSTAEQHQEKEPHVATNNTPTTPAEEAPEEDEDDPIRTAVPAELLAEPGDSCAICIDNLDDDDEVRGLTCGHAFHAACLDPWLTSRRACCPLCKADYYVPKPRAEGEGPFDGHRRGSRMGAPITMPGSVWMGGRGIYTRPRILVAGSRFTVDNDRYGFPVLMRDPHHHTHGHQHGQQNAEDDTTTAVPVPVPTTTTRTSRFRSAITPSQGRRMPWFGQPAVRTEHPQTELQTTPGQLEAGVLQQR